MCGITDGRNHTGEMGSKTLHIWQLFGLGIPIARLTSLLGSQLTNY